MVEITGERTVTTEGYRALDIDDRKCYFQDEMHLQLFEKYSMDNCWIECLMNITRKVRKDSEIIVQRTDTEPITLFRKHIFGSETTIKNHKMAFEPNSDQNLLDRLPWPILYRVAHLVTDNHLLTSN